MPKLDFYMKTLPILISVLAVALSAFSYISANTQRQRDVYFDTVSQLYKRFYRFHELKMKYPYLSHMFTTANSYEAVKREVQGILQRMSARERDEFLMRERAVAGMLLTFHEQAVYQWHNVGVQERAFTKEVVDYLETRLLRNPRILWWWTADDVGLAHSYEELTKGRWEKNVLSAVDRSQSNWRDVEGPLLKEL